MADLWLYALATLAFFIAVGIFSRWLEYRSMEHEPFDDAPFVALRSPSRTHAFDRRIEAALRDAARGFRLCRQCLFTNRALTESCVVCGCRLEEGKSPDEEKPTPLTRRQRRARARKRWVRRLGEDGETIVWSCAATEPTETASFYVLHLTKATEADTPSTGSPTDKTPQVVVTTESVTPDTVAIEIEEPGSTPPVATLTDVGKLLCELASCGVVDVTAVSDGTTAPLPVRFEHDAVASSAASDWKDWKDAVTNAEADFPSKLAQFVTATSTIFLSAALQEDDTTRSTRLSVHRDALLASSIEAIATMDRDHTRAVIRVDFVGEQGIDAGGVYREWLVLLLEHLLAPAAGVFVCVDPLDQVFYLNPHSRELLGESHLAHFLAAGRLVGRALLEGNVTGFHLALPLLKIMLGEPVGFPDLEFYDPELFRNLQWLLQNDNVDALGLDFTVVEKRPDGTSYVVELIPDGALVEVTDANKHTFVDRRLRYVLFERVRPQLFAFLQGLYDLVPPALLALLDSEELDYLVAGSDDIDVDDWQRNSQTTGNLLLHPALPHFWTVVRELSLAERRLLLQFATGSTRVPPGGFAALTSFDGRQCAFTLHGTAVWRLRGYLRSHACFNRVDLPLHFDLPTMRRAVAAAISVDTVGFTSS